MTLTQIKGLIALVTGGGSGLGRSVCNRLLKQGAKVVTIDFTPPKEYIENLIPVKGQYN